MASIRELSRRIIPASLRRRLVSLALSLQPRGLEESAIGHWVPEILRTQERLRLNLAVPSISPAQAYGGINTCVAFLHELSGHLTARGIAHELRAIVTNDDVPETNVFSALPQGRRFDVPVSAIAVRPHDSGFDAGPRDVFFATTWWTAHNLLPLLRSCHAAFGGEKTPLFYFIQDYEPQLYPLSSASLLARDTYANDWPTAGIFNSQLLADYFSAQGHRLSHHFVFEPILSDALKAQLPRLAQAKKERKILVYGRPQEARNCFSLVRMALQSFDARYPRYRNWAILSAGAPHAPIALSGGRQVASAGKLSLAAYADELLSTSVGLSLMASPHPSYPPLEMAHFGLLTVTNNFGNKDLSRAHENLISVSRAHPDLLADALADACARIEDNPAAGLSGKSLMPDYIAGSGFACALDAAALIAASGAAMGRTA